MLKNPDHSGKGPVGYAGLFPIFGRDEGVRLSGHSLYGEDGA